MGKKSLTLLLVLALILVIFYGINSKSRLSRKPTVSNIPSSQITDSVDKSTKKSGKIFLEVSEPKNNLTVTKQAVTVSGKTIADGYVFVNDQEFKADSNGNFSTTVILDEGENEVIVVVSDDLGNSVEKDITVTLESTQ